jgi:hypothetical protein
MAKTTKTEPQWATIHADFNRNHDGWPLIIPPGGGPKPIAYRRMTKFVDVLEEQYLLNNWHKRMVAIGLSQREDLRLSVLAHIEAPDARQVIDGVCRDATDYAKARAAATQGTAFHTLTDIIDRGGDLPPGLPENILKTLEAFKVATAPLKIVSIEPKTVLDTHKAAGTPDRIYELDGQLYIGDTKTGNIHWGTLKIAMQLAGYSRSWLYDVATGNRAPHGCSLNRGIIMDVDLEKCTVELRWVDLETGWWAFMIARQVWEARKHDDFDQLTKPVMLGVDRPSLRLEIAEETRAAEVVAAEHEKIAAMLQASSTKEEVLGIWEQFNATWTDALTDIGRAKLAEIDPSLGQSA